GFPPLTKTRPSGSVTIPLQNMSQPSTCWLIVPACGSHNPARKVVSVATLPEPETINTLPVLSRAACTGLIGIRSGSVVHCPITDDVCACNGNRDKTAIATAGRPTRERKCRLRIRCFLLGLARQAHMSNSGLEEAVNRERSLRTGAQRGPVA